MKKKTLALLLSLILVIGVVAGGSLAWLLDTTPEVKNTFTNSDINITLTEEAGKADYEFKMIPGWTIAKDPLVTVAVGSEDCYVFVKIEKSSNYDTYLNDYAVDNAWAALTDEDTTDSVSVDGVFYQKVTGLTANNATAWSDYVLAGEGPGENANGYVSVRNSVTKEQMNALNESGATMPTLAFTAYASQLWKNNSTEFEPYQAWVNVYNNPANP